MYIGNFCKLPNHNYFQKVFVYIVPTGQLLCWYSEIRVLLGCVIQLVTIRYGHDYAIRLESKLYVAKSKLRGQRYYKCLDTKPFNISVSNLFFLPQFVWKWVRWLSSSDLMSNAYGKLHVVNPLFSWTWQTRPLSPN